MLDEDLVAFRNSDASALRKVCRSLHWETAIDGSRCGIRGFFPQGRAPTPPLSNCKGLLVGPFAPQGPDPANEGGD
jgi:hypothetical protein